jgi:hypothetical protein
MAYRDFSLFDLISLICSLYLLLLLHVLYFNIILFHVSIIVNLNHIQIDVLDSITDDGHHIG